MKTKEEKKGEDAFEIHQRIVGNEKIRRALLAENAGFFRKMFDTKGYQTILGDEFAEWSAYLSQPDIFYTRNMVRYLMLVHKKFVEELEMNLIEIISMPITRLVDIIPFVTKENSEEWLSSARELTPGDWRILLRKQKGLPSAEECKHEFTKYDICKICGFKHKDEK